MRNLLAISSVLLLAGSASAQALNEPFNTSVTGVFPPAGWSETNNGTGELWAESSTYFFSTLSADAAAHDYYWNSSLIMDCDDFLYSPAMDLSAMSAPELTFDSDLKFAQWMAHHPASYSNGESNIDVSTDGGATWSRVWTESATTSAYYPGVMADLASVGGQAAVEMRFHYFGYDAHSWAIDNVVVDQGTPVGPALAILGSCPGALQAAASNMTPGGPVIFAYSTAAGSYTVPGGPCAGLTVPMASPTKVATVMADGSGNASLNGSVGAAACGVVTVVAVDGASCTASNLVGI